LTSILLCIVVALGSASPQGPLDHYDPTFADSTGKPVHLILITPPGETFTQEEADTYAPKVRRALDWWKELSPVPISSTIVLTSHVTLTSTEVFTYPVLATYPMLAEDHLTVFIVDNTVSHLRFHEGKADGVGFAHRATWVTTDAWSFESVQAHEFGHLYFMLPDWYLTGDGCELYDIMCWHAAAYPEKRLGCQTLEFLGHPCRRIYLPVTVRGR
jgi:hypothetical protein